MWSVPGNCSYEVGWLYAKFASSHAVEAQTVPLVSQVKVVAVFVTAGGPVQDIVAADIP